METLKDVLPTVLSRLQDPETLKKNQLFNQWPDVVGQKIAAHSKPSISKAGHLFVWVDQSALAFELNQKYRPTILKRAQAIMGSGAIKAVHVRVGQLR